MFLLVEPISRNIDVYVPAYPLPLMEIGSYIKLHLPQEEISIISMPVDYGVPLTQRGKERIYSSFLQDLSAMKPKGVGISCTAIAQAEEAIYLAELIKGFDPNIFVFMGGYFPSIYHEEIFSRTSDLDLIVSGEGEAPAAQIIEHLSKGMDPRDLGTPNLVWQESGRQHTSGKRVRFNLKQKALHNLQLLRYPAAYDILPYGFSRGCPHRCSFCLEDFMRPHRKEVPPDVVRKDLLNLSNKTHARTLLISDALFKSFDLFPYMRSLGLKVNFETRCDAIDPSVLEQIADTCSLLALGFESASYETLKRMNKVRDEAHYKQYVSNAKAVFKEAVRNEIPIMVFMIAGYPGERKEDLEQDIAFAEELSKYGGSGGYVFKIGECRVYPKTRAYETAQTLPEVVFDDDGVFGQNVVTRPSKDLDFEGILNTMTQIFSLSHYTPKLQASILNMMPFFRLPTRALKDPLIPKECFDGEERAIFRVHKESLDKFRGRAPKLMERYKEGMSGQRSTRTLPL